MRKFYTLFLLLFSLPLWAQEKMRVVRCDAVSQRSEIHNLFVDEENQKWVANERGLVQVLDLSLGETQEFSEDEQSLLELPDGNAPVTFSRSRLLQILGISEAEAENEITSASYHLRRKEMWVGTRTKGLYRLKTDPQLSLVKQYDSKNSKLKTDQINTILVDPFGRQWVGTNDGLFFGKDDKWNLKERYFNFTRIKMDSTNRVWLLADDLLGYLNRKQVWTPIELPEAALDGPLVDFTFDTKGYLWVATEIIARIDLNTLDYDIYGPAEYYTSQFVSALTCDLDGNIWVGTEDKGLFLIQPASAMTVNCLVAQALDCETMGNTAELEVRVTGGVPPFSYDWEGGLEGPNPGGLSEGTYIVTVTDSRGTSKIAKAEITDPTVVAEASMIEKESGLNQGDGRATVEVVKGEAPYTYLWDNGEKTKTAVALSEGLHSVTVTDENGCSAVAEVTMQRIISELEVQITQLQENNCHGAQEAALLAQAAGGKGPFQYAWNTGATTEELSGLQAGTYSVTVTDALDTRTESTFEVTEPEALLARIEVVSPASTGRADGVAAVVLRGGKKPFKYEWTNGEQADTARSLPPGQHNVTVTDASGCATIAAIEIVENILPLSVEVVEEARNNCFGDASAAFELQPKGGKGPYNFQWDRATLSGNRASGMVAGEYTVTVTDASGQQIEQLVQVSQPDELQVEVVENSPAIVGEPVGILEVDGQGGTAPYTFQWEDGATEARRENLRAGSYRLTITDSNGCTETTSLIVSEEILELELELEIAQEIECGGQATGEVVSKLKGGKGPFNYQWNDRSEQPNREGLVAGIYYLTVTDAAGNRTRSSIELTQPEPIVLRAEGIEIATTDQADGQATVVATGGEAPYTYAWDNGETTASATRLLPGIRTVTVTDATGCSMSLEVEIGEDIQPLNASIAISKPITCHGDSDGALTVETEGGKGPFSFNWSLADLEGQELQGRAPGIYQVTVTDAVGQTASAQVELTNPDSMIIEVNPIYPSPVNQADGNATAVVSGGVPGYSYRWDNGEQGPRARNLSVGLHSVEVIDTNGCVATQTFEVQEKLIVGLDVDNIQEGERIQLGLNFDADSTNLKPEFYPVLDELYTFLVNNPGATIEIGGHTNNIPPDFYCDEISRERAKSAAQYLIQKGIPVYRVFYKGYGKKDPIASNDTPEGRARNQRVEFKIVSYREQ